MRCPTESLNLTWTNLQMQMDECNGENIFTGPRTAIKHMYLLKLGAGHIKQGNASDCYLLPGKPETYFQFLHQCLHVQYHVAAALPSLTSLLHYA